jgi:hypothetical protein
MQGEGVGLDYSWSRAMQNPTPNVLPLVQATNCGHLH